MVDQQVDMDEIPIPSQMRNVLDNDQETQQTLA